MNEAIRQRIQLLCPLLKDSDPDVRTTAARAIEHLEVTSDIDGILQSLKSGTMGARIAAIHALGEIGGEKVIAPLVYCAGRPEADIRSAAVQVLGKLAAQSTLPILLECLNDENQAVQARAISAAGAFPPSPNLYRLLRPFLQKNDGSLEAEAALSLARLGDTESAPDIIALLSSPHASVRMAAASAVGILPI